MCARFAFHLRFLFGLVHGQCGEVFSNFVILMISGTKKETHFNLVNIRIK